MRERPEHRCYNEQHEDHDGDEVPEDYCWPATAAEGAVGDPDCEEGVHRCEGVAERGVFVLFGVSVNERQGKEGMDGRTI